VHVEGPDVLRHPSRNAAMSRAVPLHVRLLPAGLPPRLLPIPRLLLLLVLVLVLVLLLL